MKLPRRQFLHLAAGTAALPALPRIANSHSDTAAPACCFPSASHVSATMQVILMPSA